jgi:hypothetical protein
MLLSKKKASLWPLLAWSLFAIQSGACATQTAGLSLIDLAQEAGRVPA